MYRNTIEVSYSDNGNYYDICGVLYHEVTHGDAYKTYIIMSIKVVVGQCAVVSLHVYSARSHCYVMYTLHTHMNILCYILYRRAQETAGNRSNNNIYYLFPTKGDL